MPEQIQTEKLEPISIEAYKCPKCEKILVGTKEKAQEHVDIPLDSRLPKGLIYRQNSVIYIIEDNGRLILNHPVESEVYEPHTFMHLLLAEYYPGSGFRASHKVNSKEFKEALKQGLFSLLTEEEFNKSKEKYQKGNTYMHFSLKPEDLVRTTPELEALVAQEK